MPTFLVPHKSGAHRVAAIALYRALLTQCKKTNLSAANGDGTQELYNVIRHRFRGYRHCTSHKQLKVVFEAGYEAVDYLDAAVAGDEEAKNYLEGLVTKAPRKVKGDRGLLRRISHNHLRWDAEAEHDGEVIKREMAERLHSNGKAKKIPGNQELTDGLKSREQKQEQKRNTRSIVLDRPIPKEKLGGTGKRHVPVLFNANHIPVLRFKKPQSPALSGYINHRIDVRQKRHDRKARYESDILLAREEDTWDAIVNQHHGIDSRRSRTEEGEVISEPLWKQTPTEGLREVTVLLQKEKDSARVMGKKMFEIVKREKELALFESVKDEKPEKSEEEVLLISLVGEIVEFDDKNVAKTSRGEYQPFR